MYVRMHVCMYVGVFACMHAYACMHVCLSVCLSVCMSVCMHLGYDNNNCGIFKPRDALDIPYSGDFSGFAWNAQVLFSPKCQKHFQKGSDMFRRQKKGIQRLQDDFPPAFCTFSETLVIGGCN